MGRVGSVLQTGSREWADAVMEEGPSTMAPRLKGCMTRAVGRARLSRWGSMSGLPLGSPAECRPDHRSLELEHVGSPQGGQAGCVPLRLPMVTLSGLDCVTSFRWMNWFHPASRWVLAQHSLAELVPTPRPGSYFVQSETAWQLRPLMCLGAVQFLHSPLGSLRAFLGVSAGGSRPLDS